MRSHKPTNPYCIPIIKPTKAIVERILGEQLNSFQYGEVWLDYIRDLDLAFVHSLIARYPGRLVFLFRRRDKKQYRLDAETRFQIIKSIARKKAFIDLDIQENRREITRLRRSRIRIRSIISYHNYSKTPSDTEFRSIVLAMKRASPHILKTSTLCVTERDALRLLSLLLELRASGERAIILGMGKHGAITRIFGTLWGNEMVFAPAKAADHSAPGQLTKDTLDSILRTLR